MYCHSATSGNMGTPSHSTTVDDSSRLKTSTRLLFPYRWTFQLKLSLWSLLKWAYWSSLWRQEIGVITPSGPYSLVANWRPRHIGNSQSFCLLFLSHNSIGEHFCYDFSLSTIDLAKSASEKSEPTTAIIAVDFHMLDIPKETTERYLQEHHSDNIVVSSST